MGNGTLELEAGGIYDFHDLLADLPEGHKELIDGWRSLGFGARGKAHREEPEVVEDLERLKNSSLRLAHQYIKKLSLDVN
jgi:hypothetical protein